MGKLCSKETQSISSDIEQAKPIAIPQEKEITVPSYKSDGDKFFEGQEKKYNYFAKIFFQDYFHSIVNFDRENATLDDKYSEASLEHSSKDNFYDDLISPDMFQSFVENKILKHKLVYQEAENNETATSIFKKIASESYVSLSKKLAQHINAKGSETVDENSVITKGYLVPLGILHCSGPKYVKIRAIFNLFQEGGNIKTSDKLSDFLLALFLIAGYGSIHVRNKLSDFQEIGPIERSDLKKLADSSELKDSQHLVEVTNKLIFGDDLSQSLNYEAFKAKFGGDNKDTSLGFMLSPSGVRYMQLLHNV